jgi:hypothetical protein
MQPDGSDQLRLTPLGFPENVARWSPDGTKIALWRLIQNYGATVSTMNPDGSGVQTVFNGASLCGLSWQPLPVSYARPKGATPVRVSFVPAAQACTSPNETHGSPLSFPSCAPPQPGSSNITVGVGDGSPAFAKSVGSLRMDVLTGPAGPPDDTDVRLKLSITNVMKQTDLSDYTGELRESVRVRLTDRNANVPATMQDYDFGFTVPCAATSDTTLGGACSLTTTADTQLPGVAPEGERAVWGLDQVMVYDGGADGAASTTGDNTLFAVQGVFVP